MRFHFNMESVERAVCGTTTFANRGVLIVDPDTREDYGEKRWVGLGMTGGRTAYVVFTERGPDTIRIISLRKASRRESEQYQKAIQDRLEAG